MCDGAHDNVVVWHTSSSVSAASCSHCWCAWSSFVSWVFYWPCLFRACTVLWACDAQCACTESITHTYTHLLESNRERRKMVPIYKLLEYIYFCLVCYDAFSRKNIKQPPLMAWRHSDAHIYAGAGAAEWFSWQSPKTKSRERAFKN